MLFYRSPLRRTSGPQVVDRRPQRGQALPQEPSPHVLVLCYFLWVTRGFQPRLIIQRLKFILVEERPIPFHPYMEDCL